MGRLFSYGSFWDAHDGWTAPAWHEAAKCAQPGVDPTVYDSNVGRGVSRVDNQQRALDACADCPCAALCAREGLELGLTGTIRAGLPLGGPRLKQWEVDALGDIADGVPMAVAVYRHSLWVGEQL
ncbi:WhiB family transcriptional regulator [Corynebacterium striatum]|uniref:WhiB family transcriptional regulator n=1 Tax=Corynebacterium striatum TaxID=43770 RepID=UPI00254D012F|nr:WhiB family transcriptional regulator [Corynebacterium striatum]